MRVHDRLRYIARFKSRLIYTRLEFSFFRYPSSVSAKAVPTIRHLICDFNIRRYLNEIERKNNIPHGGGQSWKQGGK